MVVGDIDGGDVELFEETFQVDAVFLA